MQAVHAADAATSVALACHGSELGIWDLHQHQRSYHAKGNKPNRIGLVDKPWNTAVAFLPGSQGQRAVVGTAYHKLRLYDVKSRRPALDMEVGEAKITALAPQLDGESQLTDPTSVQTSVHERDCYAQVTLCFLCACCFIAVTKGQLCLFDLCPIDLLWSPQ